VEGLAEGAAASAGVLARARELWDASGGSLAQIRM
jgi:hypothetical protein